LSEIINLQDKLGANWESLQKANQNAADKLAEFDEATKGVTASDTSIVVYGSLARFELTSGSDIDWTLLLDGPSDPQHLHVAQKIGNSVAKLASKDVGREATFGSLVSSHDLINYIGGEGDTNSNTTRRNLLLLESRSVGSDEAYNRVKRNLLQRYLSEDSSLWRKEVTIKLPHFLLNDIVRYWRTMTVDYAYKERTRGGLGIPLRNIKLGLSRKLIFVAGLLACYTCHLDFESDKAREDFYAQRNIAGLVARLQETLRLSPLELIASILGRYPEHYSSIRIIFDTYDKFIGILLDEEKRKHLEALHSDNCYDDSLYIESRLLRTKFQEALTEIFLEKSSDLGKFTLRYGVF